MLLNFTLMLVLATMLAFSGYALWDAFLVQDRAGISSEVMHYQPVIEPDREDNPSLLELCAMNPDVIAWVTLDGTRINYPVLYAMDNSYYLNRDFYKEYSVAGSVFMDYQNSPQFVDQYSLLYGHNMSGGLMFADLLKYGDQTFFDQNQTGYLFLPGETYELEIYAYLRVDAYQTPMFSMVDSQNAFQTRLDYIRESATHYRDVGADRTQRILAMSTCSSATSDDRSIIVARMKKLNTVGGVLQIP